MSGQRNRTSDLILDAGAASQAGNPLVIAPDVDDVHLMFRLETSAASLVGDVTLKLGNAFNQDVLPANLPTMLASNVSPVANAANVTLDATNAKWTFASPASGIVQWGAVLISPPLVIVPVFTYTSGGGTVRLRIKAVY